MCVINYNKLIQSDFALNGEHENLSELEYFLYVECTRIFIDYIMGNLWESDGKDDIYHIKSTKLCQN